MPGTRITDEQRRRFYHLHLEMDGPRIPLAKAAEMCGFSKQTGQRLILGVRDSIKADAAAVGRNLPAPKDWADLSPLAMEALRDIHVFREAFLARRRQVWVYDAAMRIVEALADPTERTYIDLNIFPGAGKTTVGLDIGCWLLAGGGFCDPRKGRALRLMYGSETLTMAKHMVSGLRRILTLRRPFWDKDQDIYATHILAQEYGRFRPLQGFDPDTQWTEAQFVVAQMTEVELYNKEPTVQAASYKSGFLGERVNLAWWDDISTTKNSSNQEASEAVSVFFENEVERRIEPGGVEVLVGQRLGPLDLHRKRLDVRREDAQGLEQPLYQHVVYPAHHDLLCDGDHRQWDGTDHPGAGCLTDAWRLPVRDWMAVRLLQNYRTLFQQEDVDPSRALVLPAWLTGGTDHDGYDAIGCYDTDRAFGQHPPREVGRLVDYAAVDPSATNWWAIEWWAYQPESRYNYLIWGDRRKMAASKLLDWNNAEQRFEGLMEEMQSASVLAGHPIRCWVIETNMVRRHLAEYEHFRRWRRRWPDVAVIKHETQLNKLDPDYGVTILSTRYRTGYKRLPGAPGIEGRNFMRVMVKELTTYPGETTDTVMADWVGEYNLPRIVSAARRAPGIGLAVDAKLPGYLVRRQHQIPVTSGVD